MAVTINRDELEWAKRRAKRLRRSLSSVLSDALRSQRQSEARNQLLQKLGTDDITPEQLAEVWAEWQGQD